MAKAGGIMMFAVKKLKCMGCKTPITEQERTLCYHCRSREAEVYTQKAREVSSRRHLSQGLVF
jgi:DNA polymerase delta subunit 1